MNENSAADASGKLLGLTADIVSSFVSKNSLSTADLPKLLADVHGAIKGLSGPAPQPVLELVPAVSIRKSVTPDRIVCLEDGKAFKSLKRHLATHHGLSPEQYREKWSLPASYPMVSPNYAETRSQLARSIGLGRKAAPADVEKPRKRARKSIAD